LTSPPPRRTPLRELAASLRDIGPGRTLAVVASRLYDAGFDWYYGTDTVAKVEVEALGTSGENVVHSQIYQGTGAWPFRRMMGGWSFPPGSVFVDFGCGKGRVIVLAAFRPFAKVVGIEFSPALCAIAERNVAQVRRRHPGLAPIEVVQADVTHHVIGDRDNVFYFFHPFGEDVMERVLAGIDASVRAHPRDAWIFYYLPRHQDLMVRHCPTFQKVREEVVGGYELSVYHSRPR
jgi:SAM-dependent methyltransferase